MIRFNCPNCGRLCEVSPALAFLPLLCKGCGQSISVPKASTAEAAPPEVKPQVASQPPPEVKPQVASQPRVLDDDEDEDEPFLIPEPDDSPDIDFDIGGPTAASQSDAHRQRMSGSLQPAPSPPRPPTAPPPTAAPPTNRWLPVVADVAVGVLLLVVGGWLGEVLAQKPMRQVWNDAGSSVRFPPLDLLLWLAPPVVFSLTYGLLLSRGISIGNRLRRR